MKKPKIYEVFNYLKDSYKFLDLRCALYEEDENWISIVSVFRFTNKNRESLEDYHKKLRTYWDNTEKFKIDLKVITLEDWEDNWAAINQSITDLNKEIQIGDIEPRRNLKNSYSAWIAKPDLEYNSIQFNILLDNSEEHHHNFQFLEEHEELMSKGITSIYPLIVQILEINNFSYNSQLFSTFIFPIYVKFNNLNYTNQYLTGEIIFHELYYDSRIFIELQSRGTSEGVIGNYDLSKNIDNKQITNPLKRLEFLIYIDSTKFKELDEHFQFRIKLYLVDLNINVIEFDEFYETLERKIKNYDQIPSEILEYINPTLKFNLLERKNFKSESRKFVLKSRELYPNSINTIIEKSDWLLDFNNNVILEEFFVSAANHNNVGYFNVFKELIIFTCETATLNNYITEKETLSKLNDLVINYCLRRIKYSYKLYQYNKSLNEIEQKIINLYDKYFRRVPICSSVGNNLYLDPYGFEFPKLSKECRFQITEKITLVIEFIKNNPHFFNHNNIHIGFWYHSKLSNPWSPVSEKDLNLIRNFIDDIIKLPSVKVIDKVDVPKIINSQIYPIWRGEEYPIQEDIDWIKNNRLSLLEFKQDEKSYKFRRFNIFAGKNNSGKTYSLKSILLQPSKLLIDKPKLQEKFKRDYPHHEIYENYYIPKNRLLDKSKGKRKSVKNGLKNLCKSLLVLQDPGPKMFSQINEKGEKISEAFQIELWNIPNFIELIDFSTYVFEDDSRLDDVDRELIGSEMGKNLINSLRKTFVNWCNIIKEFFPDIEISSVLDKNIEGDIYLGIKDIFLSLNVDQWELYGAGTQELLNLIFFIELLKYLPCIDYKQLIISIDVEENIEDSVNEYIIPIRNNRILFIDEPETSLHPSLQKLFFQYLFQSSKLIQIFIATQSPYFLDIENIEEIIENEVAIFLCIKNAYGANKFRKIVINKKNYIRIIDEILDYNPLETANFLAKNDYYYILNSDFNLFELNMVRTLNNNRFEFDPTYTKLIQFGTIFDDPTMRIIQNTHFLLTSPSEINLNNINQKKNNKIESVIIFQMNKLPKIGNKEFRFERFVAYTWNSDLALREKILKYTDKQSKKIKKDIEMQLSRFDKDKLPPFKTIIIFPENSIPYNSLPYLIEFARKKKILIIGGMEHLELSEISIQVNSLKQKGYNLIKEYKYETISSDERFEDSTYINQAIIINSDQGYSFQIKNIPVYFKEYKEGIPIIYNPFFRKFNTIIGNLSILICKDFLVNYEVIDKWMDLNDIKYIIVPSFSKLVNPFRNKFSEIVHTRKNQDKTFIFANVAEYSGSGIYNYKFKYLYEPTDESPFKSREEGFKIFKLN